MKYTINIDHQLKLIRYKHPGVILAEDIEQAWGEFLTMEEFTRGKYNLFSDYGNGKFEIPVEHIPEIIEFMRKIETVVRGKKQALIVDDPYSVAGSMLFRSKVYEEVGFNVEVFTTEQAALSWLCR